MSPTALEAESEPVAGGMGGTIHRVPIIDKTMEIFALLEDNADKALRITQIVSATKLPRSTVYRILNTLVHHGLLHRTVEGGYRLGLRIKGLAASVVVSVTIEDILVIVSPALKVLAEKTHQTAKFSILDQSLAKVVALEIGTDPFAPTSRLGSAFDLHAGAASKMLLAHASAAEQKAVFTKPRARHTDATIVDAAALEVELANIRETGISHDRGEWSSNVHAVAAPVTGPGNSILGALSVTYFPKPDDAGFIPHITDVLRSVAADVSERLIRGAMTSPLGLANGA